MKIGFITVGAYMKQEDYARNNLLGSESQIFGLSKELVKKGHEVFIFRRWFESKVELINDINIISFKSREFGSGLRMTLYKLKFSREVSKYIHKIDLDVLLLMDSFTSYFILNLPIPKITVTHSEIPLELLPIESNSISTKIKYKFLSLMQKKLFKNSSLIVALNNTFKEYLDKKGYNTILIPNAICLDDYDTNDLIQENILFGGRLVKAKRIDDLIKAYSNLDDELINKFKLIIIGFGPEKSNIQELIKTYRLENSIKIMPWASKKDFINQISKCAVFILPSQYETFGIVTIEAMALKKSVIASNTYGSKDIITNMQDGFLFEIGDINNLSKTLQSLLEDENLRIKIGNNARKTIEENYTFDKISDEYIKIFKKIKINSME